MKCPQGLQVRVRHAICIASMIVIATPSFAGQVGVRQNSVGGVMVDAGGVVRAATPMEQQKLLLDVRAKVRAADGEMAKPADLRMISLKGLQAAIAEALATGDDLPEEIRYLAGLQRIEYVLAYPEQNDIVIAGPAEPWIVRDDAAVVGAISGQPMMLIDDLVTAMQSVEAARQGGISCSIEPTAEGHQRLNRLLSKVQLRNGQNPKSLEPQMKQAFGPQMVKLNGVPTDSHYARILVAADYQMKRIAMGLESSRIAGLPSYLEMARGSITQSNANPRWWMACDYNSLSHSDDKLSWKLSGRGVKTMTENDLIGANGQVVGNAKADPKAQKWADLMTEHYGELSQQFPVFGQLRNMIDMSVVATLIVQERLDETAGVNLDLLMGRGSEVPVAVYTAPAAISPECSFLRGRKGWIVTTSGGVDINAFEIVENQAADATLGAVHSKASAAAGSTWWWNG
ncbi:hypothetical protein Poly24_25970 [Rosistilla carotiformis]|uniref:DUF1598 domain-containing protein n=1 Tax=Rosistilla carotiformis TaxID=2528017 RepID=A0A518JTK9_9BACT|nr:DUF1598 domain-containing protein [Rosistilla carotiformis]QDV68884.1 hypothetical protein Poly24_25970 [Rosistilla carotiformis]